MELKETHSLLPSKFGYHLNQQPLAFASHPSSFFFSFSSRGGEVIYHNRKTGRSSVIFASKHGIEKLIFTEKYLIVIEKGYPEILVFSIKSNQENNIAEKLKKKLSGHRNQVINLAYCPQRAIFCSSSHDVCLIWDEATLNVIKMLKCSTSSYCDCHFTFNGQYLFTSFSDGNVFCWDLESYEAKKNALSIEPHNIVTTQNHFVAAYSEKKISIADFSDVSLIFETIDKFWEGYIEKVDFLDSYIFIKTSNGFYSAEILQEHKITLRNHKKLIDQIYAFEASKYSSEIIIISKDLSKIRTMKVFNDAISSTIPLTNPLINPGHQCIGGYSEENGCVNGGELQTGYNFSSQNYKIESFNDGMYHKVGTNTFSSDKIQTFIRKNFIFPDKYRPITYQSSLNLPISKHSFRELEKKGRHPCVKLLDNKYPLDNINLSEALKDTVSLLAHYSPIFAESDLIPTIVFPFVCIFGEDRFFCFEVLYRLFNNWLSCIFENFPLANSELLQNIQEIFEKEDQILLNHLNEKNISFTKLAWSLLSTLFSTNLSRDGFLAVADTLISHPKDPSFLIFMVIAYIEYNRTRILSMKSEADLDIFLEEEHTVNISVFIKKAYELRDKFKKEVRYPFRGVRFEEKIYKEFDCFPKHAVKMYEGKRRLEEEQYEKIMNEEKYHDEIAKEMEKMVLKVKRESGKSIIESQAIALQSENESKFAFKVPKANTNERKKRLNELMAKLEEMLSNQDSKKQKVREFIPFINQLQETENEEELDDIENKLMDLLTKLEPHQFNLPLTSQPLSLGKTKVDNFKVFRAAKRAQLANNLWETDEMGHNNQEKEWENDFEKAMHA